MIMDQLDRDGLELLDIPDGLDGLLTLEDFELFTEEDLEGDEL